MRVVTYNILSYGHADGARRTEVIRAELARLRPDVVAVQEVTRTPGWDQSRELLGPDFTIVDHPEPERGRRGRLPGRAMAGRGGAHARPARRAGRGRAAVGGRGRRRGGRSAGPALVVHHKPNWQLDREHVREAQAVAVARFVRELTAGRADLPVVLLGDFDAGPEQASIRFLTGRQSLAGTAVRYEDAWEAVHPDEPGHTFSPRNPLVTAGEMAVERGRRIDHVMVGGGPHGPLLDVADCRLVLDEPVDGVWASDHFGVLADLAPPAHRPGAWV